MSGALVLFTRDLRVNDHPALAAAAGEHGRVVPAFVLSDELLGTSAGSPARVAFLLDCLRDLDESLAARGSRLVLRRGDIVAEAIALARRHELTAIHISADHGPFAVRRDRQLLRACEQERIELRTFPGITAVEPGALVPAGGDHYRVFTPYWRAWSETSMRELAAAPAAIGSPADLDPGRIPELAELTGGEAPPDVLAGGEEAGLALLEHWLSGGVDGYGKGRDELAFERTSRLSAHLHFGALSAGQILARLPHGEGAQSYARQLCWRDFHHQVLAARPDITRADYRPRGDHWRSDPAALEAWREGLTGYPIVDAGMRQLAREGFMHNRARMIVASFLTKLLYVDWRAGADHFARLLADADVANNICNWQWVAGTGNDTRPNRVLNPMRQAEKLDPDGDYVRRHVPELAHISGRAVHAPWQLPRAQRPAGYPAPIVDHADAAERLRRARSEAAA